MNTLKRRTMTDPNTQPTPLDEWVDALIEDLENETETEEPETNDD